MGYRPRRRPVRLRSTFKLERAMKDRDLSGADLARFVGVTRQYISQIRAGDANPRDTHAVSIERALGVPHGALFDFGDEPAEATNPATSDASAS